jgi:rhamnosyltransferase
MSKKRAAVYVFYDKDGIVDSYVIFMLQELLKVCETLVVVCNGQLSDYGRASLNCLTDDIVVRENVGFDAWAYKTGMEYIGWDKLSNYDELILINDTVFGPFYPFKTIFDEMDSKDIDFWGITKHGEYNNPDGLTKSGIFPEHIQSYFIVFGNKILTSEEFEKYWNSLRKFKTWNETVSFFESQLTKHFAQLGFSWDVYVNTDGKYGAFNDVSLILQLVYELVKEYKCPFIKRKSFTLEYGNFITFNIGESSRKAFDYIRENTDYDVDLIWEHILRTGCLRNIKDNLHLNYILPERYVNNSAIDIKSAKVALFAHITYEDQIDFCLNYLSSGNGTADLYVTTLSEKTEKSLTERLSSIWSGMFKVIVLPENSKGRDVGALWVALKPYMESYDYICFIHNKKSPQIKPLTVGRGFAQRCFVNTLASKEYFMNIITLFEENPRLGMLFPPPVIHGPYSNLLSNLWTGNFYNTVALAKKLNVNVLIENDSDPIFPAGGMFWFRTKALKKIINHEWRYEDFPDEPMPEDGSIGHAFERIYSFTAQDAGFYSAWVLTDKFILNDLTTLNYLLSFAKPKVYLIFRRKVVDMLQKCPQVFEFLRYWFRFVKKLFRKVRGK